MTDSPSVTHLHPAWLRWLGLKQSRFFQDTIDAKSLHGDWFTKALRTAAEVTSSWEVAWTTRPGDQVTRHEWGQGRASITSLAHPPFPTYSHAAFTKFTRVKWAIAVKQEKLYTWPILIYEQFIMREKRKLIHKLIKKKAGIVNWWRGYINPRGAIVFIAPSNYLLWVRSSLQYSTASLPPLSSGLIIIW